MTKQELIQAAKEIRDICHNKAVEGTGTWADCKNVRSMLLRVSSSSARMGKKHIRL